MSLERDLKQAFERHAGDVRPSTDPLGEATSRLQHSRRRRAAGYALAAVAVAAALGVALPKLVGTHGTQTIKPGPRPTQNSSGLLPVTGPIEDIQLVAPGHGWIIQGGHQYWTADAGRTWETLSGPRDHSIVAGFARKSRIWGVAPTSPGTIEITMSDKNPEPCKQVHAACTGTVYFSESSDARVKQPPNGAYGPISISFLDATHGWLYVDLGGGSGAEHLAQLFRTSDAGKTWMELANPPLVSPATGRTGIAFVSALTGYIDNGRDLFRSSDGGHTWHSVTLEIPKASACSGTKVVSSAPIFWDDRSGAVGVLVPCSGTSAQPYVFVTRDGGMTWSPTTAPQGGSNTFTPNLVFSAPDAADWFEATIGNLLVSHDQGRFWNAPRTAGSLTGIDRMIFVDGNHGWATAVSLECNGDTARCAKAYQTSDGGATWTPLSVALPPSASPCRDGVLSGRVSSQRTDNDQTRFTIDLKNLSDTACAVSVTPYNVEFFDDSGRRLSVAYQLPASAATENGAIIVDAGADTDHLNLWWKNWCGSSISHFRIRITLDDGVRQPGAMVDLPVGPAYDPPCQRRGSASMIALSFP